jgi:competence ComEA-like helix-hairpin-helix protein
MKTNTLLHDYFYYTRTEKKGAALLCLLIGVLFLTPFFLKQHAHQFKSTDFQAQFANFTTAEHHTAPANVKTATTLFDFNPNNATREELLQLGLSPKVAQTLLNFRNKGGVFYQKKDLQKIYGLRAADYKRLEPYIQLNSAETATLRRIPARAQNPARLFPFNPNTATKAHFTQLGLPDKTAATILKFREKGGAFRTKEDLQKIYGLKTKDYERLAPYIVLEPTIQTVKQKPIAATAAKSPDFNSTTTTPHIVRNTPIDINQADAAAWQTLRGIGPAYAKRIVRFRDKLGGFSSVEQVRETFGLPDSTFQAIKPHLKASPILQTILINTATVEELNAHPYIDGRKAAAIVSYRSQHGRFESINDLRQMKALPADWLEKISPYLKFD